MRWGVVRVIRVLTKEHWPGVAQPVHLIRSLLHTLTAHTTPLTVYGLVWCRFRGCVISRPARHKNSECRSMVATSVPVQGSGRGRLVGVVRGQGQWQGGSGSGAAGAGAGWWLCWHRRPSGEGLYTTNC